MFLARIDGTLTSTVKHETLNGSRFLIGQRLSGRHSVGRTADHRGHMGAARGALVLVSTDGDVLRKASGQHDAGEADRGGTGGQRRRRRAMRIGVVRGHVVLNQCVPELRGTRLLIVEPVTSENLAAGKGKGGGKALIVADRLGAGQRATGRLRRRARSRESVLAGNVPVDAYCSLIVDHVDYPTAATEGQVMSDVDFSILKVITAQDIEAAAKMGATTLNVRAGAVITPSARDVAAARKINLFDERRFERRISQWSMAASSGRRRIGTIC
jgi:microcompartment protein CcmK/EutM